MSTLDDKLLGEKTHYYCSSSEEEDNNTDGETTNHNIDDSINSNVREEMSYNSKQWNGSSVNTGPKGVIKDWQRYKQFEIEKRDAKEKEKLELMKKLSITCRSHLDEEISKNQNQSSDSESDDMNDDFLREYMIKRMHEMMQQMDGTSKEFGQLIHLDSGSEFLEAIDKEDKNVTIICHISNSDVNYCQHMNGCLSSLAKRYTKVKFCAIEASTAGMSKHFSKSGVPAILVYKSGNLLSNFVRLTDQFSETFSEEDVEKFLIEHSVLNQSSALNPDNRRSIRDCEDNNEEMSD